MHWRRRAFAKTGVIGRDQMVGVRQFWHQVSEHLRRSRETVQQEYRWVLRRTGFAVEDIQSIDVDGFVSNRHSLFLRSHSVSASNLESKMKRRPRRTQHFKFDIGNFTDAVDGDSRRSDGSKHW